MKRSRLYWLLPALVAALVATTAASGTRSASRADDTATPIKHLVVIFQENVSFDHYFGTYPNAAGTDGRPFAAAPGTPAVAGLLPATDSSLPVSLQHSTNLTTSNPNLSLPARLDSTPLGNAGGPGGQITCDQDHNYSDEQQSFDGGLMDQFVQSVGQGNGTSPGTTTACNPKLVMDYYDGNTVTGFWNYAQHYAMSDNSYDTTFGPSAPGAINVVSGDTGGVDMTHKAGNVTVASSTAPNADVTPDGNGGYSLTSDAQPYWDDCSTRDAVALSGTNIGDELNAAGLSWGWFQGGFRPTTTFAAAAAAPEIGHAGQTTATFIPDEFAGSFTGKVVPTGASNQALCDAVHPAGAAFGYTIAAPLKSGATPLYKDDYIAHHEPFQYYASTANPHHLTIPTDAGGNDTTAGLATIGTDTQSKVGGTWQFDTPNHNYDTSDFDQLVAAINAGTLPASALPAVTYLKAPGYEDGHAAYSDPADEQNFVVNEVNALEKTPDWSSTAVFINYDDSDGWYDHVYSGVINPSSSGADNLTDTVLGKIKAGNPTSGKCGTGGSPLGGQQGRCGFSSRLPMIVISPWARTNFVDHNISNQASVVNFIEYNWHLPAIPGSFDAALATQDASEHIPFDLAGAFDFSHISKQPQWQLDPATGQIDLRNATLKGQNLKGDNVSGAEAQNADIQGTNLQGAFLENINLSGATLQGANLQGADLTGANLTGASLKGANTNKVTWSHTTCVDGTNSDADGGTCENHL